MADIPSAEVSIGIGLVRDLLADQCPSWVGLPLARFAHGWDNELYALGDDLLVRLPRRRATAPLIDHEAQALRHLGPRLPLPVPVPLFVGEPGRGYPFGWSVVPRLTGRPAAAVAVSQRRAAAADLAGFLIDLHRPAPIDAPLNPFRGVPLAHRRDAWRPQVLAVAGEAAWEQWLGWAAAPAWPGPPVWVHGDPHPLNLLLADDGRLAAVIDWGDVTSGDPASDLAMAWLGLDSDGLATFGEACAASGRYDPAIWDRAKAWALGLASVFVHNSDDQPDLRAIGRHGLDLLTATG